MSGTKKGGLKAAATNKKRYGDNFYVIVGGSGGASHSKGGFKYMAEHDPQRLRSLGSKGGSKSRRKV